ALPPALPHSTRRRDRAREGCARDRRALRLPLDPLALSVPVRGPTARLQHRHRQRSHLRTRIRTRRGGNLRSAGRLYKRRQRAPPRRLDDATLRRPAKRRARHPDGTRAGYVPGNGRATLRLFGSEGRSAARAPEGIPRPRRGNRTFDGTERTMMVDPRHNIRAVRAPRGDVLNAKSWLTEAPLR